MLYYDKRGLLGPSGRTPAGYRLYSEDDRQRLEQIIMLRSLGLTLKEIKSALGKSKKQLYPLLEQQFHQLNGELARIKNQQKVLVGLLQNPDLLAQSAAMTKEKWVSLLKASGLSEADMDQWHKNFEKNSPDKHQEFLEFLGIPPETIKEIREKSRQP